jgi:hypothetical protein
LAGLAGAERVGKDDEVAVRVERLAGAEQLAGERGVEHAGAAARGAVQHEHRLAGRLAERRVVQLQLGQHLAGVEAEVLRDPVASVAGGRSAASEGSHGVKNRAAASAAPRSSIDPIGVMGSPS